MKAGRLLSCLLLAAIAVAAQAGLVLGPRYHFEAGSTAATHIVAQIDGVQLGSGVPLAVTGTAEVDVTFTVREVGEDGIATIVASFGPVTGELMGQAQNSEAPAPMELRVDPLGRLVGATGAEDMDMSMFTGGGIPVQLVVLLTAVAELPPEPVALGETWSRQSQQQLADMGEVTVRFSSRLLAVDDEGARLSTDVSASFPDFTAPNPLQGGEVNVQNAVLTVNGMKRTIDTTTGLARSAQATMRIDCMATVDGFTQLPLTVDSSFSVAPAEPAEEQAAPQAALPRSEAPVGGQEAPSASRRATSLASAVESRARTLGARTVDALTTIARRMGWL